MSVNSNKIFHAGQHLLTSPFGQKRPNGRIHQGVDYGTYGKNIPQFPPRNYATVVKVVNKETIGNERGLYVELQWKSIDRGLILQHLDSACVKVGDIVNVNDCIGRTGDTGLNIYGDKVSSGIHAHIELYIISTGKRLDFDTWNMEEDMTEQETTTLVNNILAGKGTTVSEWAKESWQWAIDNGLTDGTAPKGYLQREQAMALFYRFYNTFIE